MVEKRPDGSIRWRSTSGKRPYTASAGVHTPTATDSRIGIYFPVNRIAEKVTWLAPYPGWIEGMVLAGDNLLLYAKDKLRIYAAADGKPLGEMDLEHPVWDGLAAAGGRLYMSTKTGKTLCLSGK